MSTVHYSGQIDSGHDSCYHYFARCGSVQGWTKAHPEPFHICYAPDAGGETLLRRCLRPGSSVPFADCEPWGRRKLRPSRSSAALLFVRPAAGAPRRLSQRYALCRVERYAHDREAVVIVGRVCFIARAVFTYHRAITAVSSLYTLNIIVYGLQCLL